MPQEVHIFAVLHPAAGKVDRINELMKIMCKNVHEKEDYTLRYLQTQQIDHESGNEPDICIFETYKDKSSAEQHTTEPHFKEFFGTAEKEGLFGSAPYVAKTVSSGGFDSDKKLL